MIETLTISNYALIDNIEITFAPGFNIITGETGAGKSIMLGALSMLLGNRADTRVVTDKTKKSVVEAVLDVSRYPTLRRLLESNDIDWDDRQLILRREINPAGRSRSFVNDVPVALTLLREVAVRLVDIHSQHQNLLLASPDYQLGILDTLLPDKTPLTRYEESFDCLRTAMKKYRHARTALATGRTEEEYLRFQLGKLDELNPQPGEQQLLEQERDTLANVNDIKTALNRIAALLADGEPNAESMLREASSLAASLQSLPEAADIEERLEALRIEAADIADTVASLDSNLEANPARLEHIEERLAEIYTLEHKFGVDTVDDLARLREELSSRLALIDNGDEKLRALAAEAKAARQKAMDDAAALTAARRSVAERFAARLQADALPLGMKNLRVDISFTPADLCASGADKVDFLFSFNKNQQPMPVRDTASGGEISRLMLVVKSIVAEHLQLPSIIFDEVDTGVSGDVANRMGRLMKQISDHIQVIAITHLPQVAAMGGNHFKVYKEDSDTTTNTRVVHLDGRARIDELALMLSGDADNPSARQTAADMLSANENPSARQTAADMLGANEKSTDTTEQK